MMGDMSEDTDLYRQSAHVILDVLTAEDSDAPESEQSVEAAQLAFQRLLEIEAIELTYDEDEEELELDMSPLLEGVMMVVRHLTSTLADRDGISQEEVVQSTRAAIDAG